MGRCLCPVHMGKDTPVALCQLSGYDTLWGSCAAGLGIVLQQTSMKCPSVNKQL
uniref:Uncharacterized protein n=1 Tax=Anguilla anguilla TaxID=7936 RepID=A0A0E9WEV9_ANGAN